MAEAMGGDLVLKILNELTSLKDELREDVARTDRSLGQLTRLLGEMAEETRKRLSGEDRAAPTLED